MSGYTDEEIQQLVELVGKLLEAYLRNEMSRTKQLKQIIKEYEARINYNSSN